MNQDEAMVTVRNESGEHDQGPGVEPILTLNKLLQYVVGCRNRKTKLEAETFQTLSLWFFHRSEYEYGFTVKHSSQSKTHARGVHVTWMLTPFIKIRDVTPSMITGSFRIDQKDDSVTFIVRTFHSTLF